MTALRMIQLSPQDVPTFLGLLGEFESILLCSQEGKSSSFISSGNKHMWELLLGAYVGYSLKGRKNPL